MRRYFSEENAVNHYHSIYSAHLAAQLGIRNSQEEKYQKFFDFFGTISYMKWNELVKSSDGGKGKLYFQVLNNYSILPHLSHSHFASRPVSRGKDFNIDTIRAIPFVMILAQFRDFSSAYYGTGTAFDLGIKILMDYQNTTRKLYKTMQNSKEKIPALEKLLKEFDILPEDCSKIEVDAGILKLLSHFPSVEKGVELICWLLQDLHDNQTSPIVVLRDMFIHYPPFKYSIENKETALQIRNKKIVDLYLTDATEEEREIFEETEREAELTKQWILDIMDQDELIAKSLILKKNVNSEELFLLHLIQSTFLKAYRVAQKKGDNQTMQDLQAPIQMTILAISEGLGFGG